MYGIDDATGFWYFVASTEFTDITRKAYGFTLVLILSNRQQILRQMQMILLLLMES